MRAEKRGRGLKVGFLERGGQGIVFIYGVCDGCVDGDKPCLSYIHQIYLMSPSNVSELLTSAFRHYLRGHVW